MTQRVLAVVFIIVAHLLAPSAWAASSKVLYTAPAQTNYPTLQTLYCDILNVDTQPMSIAIDVIDYFGGVVQTLGPVATDSGKAQALGDATGIGAYCRFTISGSAKKVRAIGIYDNGVSYTVTIPAY